ncbi:hypothetical protein TWF569_006447 [Orbilia oligospora]|nr:hypothetical protein TWF103_005123 [Orbilia oligospora]KAF3146441.1 hypothetical protein TWF569_006447 [Orbilia oligospora]
MHHHAMAISKVLHISGDRRIILQATQTVSPLRIHLSQRCLPPRGSQHNDDQATSLQRQTIMHQWEIYKRAIKINIRITREPDDTIYKSLRSLGSSIRRQILFSTLRIQTFPRLDNAFAF